MRSVLPSGGGRSAGGGGGVAADADLDLAIAKSLQDEEDRLRRIRGGGGGAGGARGEEESSKSARIREDEDFALALSIQLGEESPRHGVSSSNISNFADSKVSKPPHNHDNIQRSLKEDEDFAKALAMQFADESTAQGSSYKSSSSDGGSYKNNSSSHSGLNNSNNNNHGRSNNSVITKGRVCTMCNQALVGSFIVVGELHMHSKCFRCTRCTKQIEGSFVPKNGGYYHSTCAEELFSPKCTICCGTIRNQYFSHGFFEGETYCVPCSDDRRSCFSCNRSEPKASTGKEQFSELPDKRLICGVCVKTVVIDSSEALPLYLAAVDFFERVLKLRIPEGMRSVPILAVDIPALNENGGRESTNHGIRSKQTTRGLTMSQAATVRHMVPGSLAWDNRLGQFVSVGSSSVRVEVVRSVSCVLVLYGLPRDLCASILAHEAMHVWLKLSKDYPFQLPPKVEEGMCQVIADKFLEYLDREKAPLPKIRTGGFGAGQVGSPLGRSNSEEIEVIERSLQRNYFRHLIDSDPSEVYGDGFREAVKCVDALGLDILLEHIRDNKALPKM